LNYFRKVLSGTSRSRSIVCRSRSLGALGVGLTAQGTPAFLIGKMAGLSNCLLSLSVSEYDSGSVGSNGHPRSS
jgi:hypothetical protein